jgi:rhodanese-related sulfurtransferase/DNA-directed RNA polymerase subunit RPC12/RpoP
MKFTPLFAFTLPLTVCIMVATLQYQDDFRPADPLRIASNNSLSAPLVIAATQTKYVCTPCGNDCDKDAYDKPGMCTHCGMTLINKATIGFTDIDFAGVCARLKANPKAVLLDVRSPGEFKGTSTDVETFGHFKNAINVNITELDARVSELSKYKDQEVIVYCSHSHRSPRASYFLANHGFKNVKNVAGGVSTLSTTPACLDKYYVKHAH